MFVDTNEYCIQSTSDGRQALQKLDSLSHKESRAVFVVNEQNRLLGTITDGDIRRGLLSGREISEDVTRYMNPNFKFILEGQVSDALIKSLKESGIYLLPVLNGQGQITKIIDLKRISGIVPAIAFIMAGGRGERLKPLTDVTPKPLLQVGKKPIIEHNIDRLAKYGIEDFYVSIRYLGDQIRAYLGDGSKKGIRIHYIEEIDPLGTIGSLQMLPAFKEEYVFVMNSDILTNVDIADFFERFISTEADMAVASVPYRVNIPYGVMELSEETHVMSLKEKPTYVYYSNAGIYFIRKWVKDLIPQSFYNATDLMEELIRKQKKVVSYPILNYWLDIGRHEDYIKAKEDIKHIYL